MILKRLTNILFVCLISAPFVDFAAAQSNFNSFANFGQDNSEPIQIEAVELEVLDQENKAVFKGDVIIVQGTSTLKSQLLTIYYDGSGSEQQNITKIEASGGVLVTSVDQKATADEAVFDTNLNQLLMTGEEVVLSQGANVIVGSRLEVELESGRAKMGAAEGSRVKVLLDSQQLNTSN